MGLVDDVANRVMEKIAISAGYASNVFEKTIRGMNNKAIKQALGEQAKDLSHIGVQTLERNKEQVGKRADKFMAMAKSRHNAFKSSESAPEDAVPSYLKDDAITDNGKHLEDWGDAALRARAAKDFNFSLKIPE